MDPGEMLVLQSRKLAGRIKMGPSTYPGIGKENTLKLSPYRERHHVLILANLVALHVLNGVVQGCMPTIGPRWTVSDGHDIVSPRSTSHSLTLLSEDSIRRAKECVHTHIVVGGHGHNVRIAQRQSWRC